MRTYTKELPQADISDYFWYPKDLPDIRNSDKHIITAINDLFDRLIADKNITSIWKTKFAQLVKWSGVAPKNANATGYHSAIFVSEEGISRILLAVQEHVEETWNNAKTI